jgi:hypothetical protein
MKIGVRPQASGLRKKHNQSGAGFQPAPMNRPKAGSYKEQPRAAVPHFFLAGGYILLKARATEECRNLLPKAENRKTP